MRYCWSHADNKRSLLVPAWIFVSLGCICCLFSLFRLRYFLIAPASHVILVYLILFSLLVYSLFTAFVVSRRYHVTPSGITIYYPLRIKKHFYWDQFSEIALCKIHYASASNKHILAIRCVIGTEKRGPRQAVVAKEKWTTPEYEIIHHRQIISIFFTPDRIAEFHRFCPHPLADYRHLEDRS